MDENKTSTKNSHNQSSIIDLKITKHKFTVLCVSNMHISSIAGGAQAPENH